jgi:Domain of unknown function (DUF5076)
MARQELPEPAGVAGAKEADEIVRGWLIDGKLDLSVQVDAFEDPGAWGIFLADVAKTVAAKVASSETGPAAEVLSQIVDMFNVIMTPGLDDASEEFMPPPPPIT